MAHRFKFLQHYGQNGHGIHNRSPNRFNSLGSYALDLTDDQQAVEFVRRANMAGPQELSNWLMSARVNLSWAAGRQLTDIDETTNEVSEDPSKWASSPTTPFWVNWMRRVVKHMINRILSSDFTFAAHARGAMPQRADLEGAKAAEALLQYIWRQTEMDESVPRALWYLILTSVLYIAPTWEEDEFGLEDERILPNELVAAVKDYRSRIIAQANEVGSTIQPERLDADALLRGFINDEIGVPIEHVTFADDGGIILRYGHPRICFLTGFDVIEDMSVRNWEDKRWFITRHRVPLASALERYGDRAAKLVSDNLVGDQSSYDRSYEDSPDGSAQRMFEYVMVDRLHHRRCQSYPDGWYTDVCQTTVLESGPNPYEHGEVPLVRVLLEYDEQESRPEPGFSDFFHIQRAINDLQIDLLNSVYRTANPGYWAVEGSVDRDEVERGYNQIDWVRDPQDMPRLKEVPPPPSHAIHINDRLVEYLKELGGLTDPSIGRPTGDAKSGVAIRELKERADLNLNEITRKFSSGLGQAGSLMLTTWAQFVPGQNQIALDVLGELGEIEYVTFLGRDLVAQGQNSGRRASSKYDIETTIDVKPNLVQVVDQIDLLLARGVLDPRRHGSRILAAINDRDLSELDLTLEDRNRCAWEHEQIKLFADSLEAGEIEENGLADQFASVIAVQLPQNPQNGEEMPDKSQLAILVSDDPEVHLDEHTRFVQRYYDKLPTMLVRLLLQHIAVHQTVLIGRQNSTAQSGQQGRNGQSPRRGGSNFQTGRNGPSRQRVSAGA